MAKINYQYSQSWRKNKPIFFEAGKRVSLQRGIELTKQGKFGKANHLVKWFANEGIDVCVE